MIFYSKRLTGKRPKKSKFFLRMDGGVSAEKDDKSQPLSQAKLMYNCTGYSGALEQIDGIDSFLLENARKMPVVPQPIIKAWHYKRTDYASSKSDDRMILLLNDMKLYELKLSGEGELKYIGGDVFEKVPDAVNYKLGEKDVIMFSSPSDSLTVYDGENEPYKVDSAPKIRSMCMHYERLFAVGQDNLLWFSDDLDPTNWNISLDQAGYIEFADTKGKLLKVVSFMDYIYIFRQYGITRLTAYAEQSEFYVNEIYSTAGIYPDTVAVCGDSIYFLSTDGLYSFDGLNTKKILNNLSELFDENNDEATACCVNNQYLLSCKMKFDTKGMLPHRAQLGNNAIFRLFVSENKWEIIGADNVGSISSVMSEKISAPAICLKGDYSNMLGTLSKESLFFDRTATKAFLTAETDFGLTTEYKTVKDIEIYTKTDITAAICADEVWSYYSIKGKKSWQKVPINKKAKLFRFGFFSTAREMLLRPVCLNIVTY